MIRRTCVIPSVSNADDMAFESLADAVRATADRADARMVGGHMAGLLLAAFPVGDLVPRRTGDADAGISAEIAGTEVVHERLMAAGYKPERGNRLVRGDRAIDLLVPSLDGRFRPLIVGGRAYDATPGLALALSGEPIVIDVTVVYTDGREDRFDVSVPTVEAAVILKANATANRSEPKDVTDLHHLLSIRNQYGDTDTGGWRLDDEPLAGSRLDAARLLHRLADGARKGRLFIEAEVPPSGFTALVREWVTAPVLSRPPLHSL
ncbi:hypothetical protein [Frigoribacterium faeni]|uniref:FHA domain-containing protein n=1 Tax=Frigoribacterium faeni TaxID=145483 RepID=A0A7W3PJT2_9MICO|nr:hypothetical protein [Frigoribacterium faeni]MBA8814830.1 hypothetical protein [Frigoribacterium faeni]BFF15656.1 nucleotidyl transferase AbiEii/AbiGii toxin family protein [Microbacterium flavescens]GEK82994.1 hypothetical protein FFA01_13030 [Frigoribacterium faeni]